MGSEIRAVDGTDRRDLEDAIKLIYAYVATLNVDLTFQKFDEEMAGMPGKYAPPRGTLLLARNEAQEPLGCVGLCPAPANVTRDSACEIKRLYVTPAGRGTGIGKALVERAIADARRLGYKEMLLDSLSHMVAAQRLYKQLGFVQIEAYYPNPHSGVVYQSLRLNAGKDREEASHAREDV